ncbi:DUF6221 family protein [Streptosporangium sp. NPDC000563]|uniref:DUF6221 family protein n=1 Tax=Streptosporangium sp. NPDC000563 TaxID=3154366 RepID=UPI003322AAF6
MRPLPAGEAAQNPVAALVAAHLDDDEQTVRAVGCDDIEAVDYLWGSRYLQLRSGDKSEVTTELPAELANHIARYDPSRVLDEVAAKRRILARHPGATASSECPGCGAHLDGTWVTPPGGTCPELADLAAPYVSPEAERVVRW